MRRPPTELGKKAAEAYLRLIDGSDFGTEDGHDIEGCANCIDRAARLPHLIRAIRQAQAALRPFVFFQHQFDRMPMRGKGDEIYGIHTGTEFEADLRFSHLKAAVKALDALGAALPPLDSELEADASKAELRANTQ